MANVFGDGEEGELNFKLARNVTIFATAVFVFKKYGFLFAAE